MSASGPQRGSGAARVALVPGVLALLPEYAGSADPVAGLRASCLAAVAWLGEAGGFGVLGSAQGVRVARSLGAAVGVDADLVTEHPTALLVVGNGSARRTEKAPGHLDDRAAGFDAALGAALRAGDLSDVDLTLGERLWADTDSLAWLREERVLDGRPAVVDYDDAPFGVQYWVMRWACAS